MTHIDHVVTSGIFSLDGEDFEVDNNIWIVGDDREVVVLDAAHDHRPILDAVGGRRVRAIVCTHAHNDHINAAAELAESTDAPILLHPDDAMLWEVVYPDRRVDDTLSHGDRIDSPVVQHFAQILNDDGLFAAGVFHIDSGLFSAL